MKQLVLFPDEPDNPDNKQDSSAPICPQCGSAKLIIRLTYFQPTGYVWQLKERGYIVELRGRRELMDSKGCECRSCGHEFDLFSQSIWKCHYQSRPNKTLKHWRSS